MSKEIKSPEVAKLNAVLRSANCHVAVQQLSDRLYLRATLPPKPGSGKREPFSQRISLGVYANPAGLKYARAEALQVSADVAMGRFSWDKYLKKKAVRRTVQEWLEAFEADYFSRRERNPKSLTTWGKDYADSFKRLPYEASLSVSVMLEAIAQTEPDSRTRKRVCMAYSALARFADLELDVSRLKGTYSPKAVRARDLPSDELIIEWRDRIPREDWRWFYSACAAYGFRPHEVFNLDLESIRKSPMVRVLDGKTGFHLALPIMPTWWEDWRLYDVNLPDITADSNRGFGMKAAEFFKRLKLPFTLYDLRHAWAARAARENFPDTLAAKLQGHSPQMHNQVYQQFVNESHLMAAWEQIRKRDGAKDV